MSNRKYRIFISSVQKELEVERVSIAGMMSSDPKLSGLCDVVLYEREALSGKRIAKPYLKCLDTCDIYVLLMDREYGRTSGEISATHEEYRHALKRDMPMMIFLRGGDDQKRTKETQDFFNEIKLDGHTYRRFHDRIDLLPEIERGLRRIFREEFGEQVEEFAEAGQGQAGKASTFEQQILDVGLDELDLEMAGDWLVSVGKLAPGAPLSTSDIGNCLRARGLLRKEGDNYKAMGSGLLFLGKNPALLFPQCRVLADAYTGLEPDASPKDQVTLSGPAPWMIEQVVNFVIRNTRHPIRVVGIRRVKLDEYPAEVVREAIVNAVAHRDYEDAARPIYVKLFFDRLEILSPGNLLAPLTLAKLRRNDFEPCSRNPVFGHYLNQMRLMEQRGSGIRRMTAMMLDHGLNAPEFSFRDGYFRVLLQGPGDALSRLRLPEMHEFLPPSVMDRLDDRHKKILAEAAGNGFVTTAWVIENLGVVRDTARRDFAYLMELNLLVREGRGRATRYVPVSISGQSPDNQPIGEKNDR